MMKSICTSSISIAEIWESPYIAQTNSITNTGQEKIKLPCPIAPLLILIILELPCLSSKFI